MKDGRFQFKSKEETDAMSLEEKLRYFQELMRELKRQERELGRKNLEIAQSIARMSEKPSDSQQG